MTERILGPTGGGRRKRFALLLPFMALAALILAIGAYCGPGKRCSRIRGSERQPGRQCCRWNRLEHFRSGQLDGTAPDRVAIDLEAGWQFEGLEDAQVTTSEDSFAGRTEQDDACATVNTGKAPNKDDLKRIYLASKTVSGHTYLMLGWVRIPQNSPAPSATISASSSTAAGRHAQRIRARPTYGGQSGNAYGQRGGHADHLQLRGRKHDTDHHALEVGHFGLV